MQLHLEEVTLFDKVEGRLMELEEEVLKDLGPNVDVPVLQGCYDRGFGKQNCKVSRGSNQSFKVADTIHLLQL